MRICENCGNEYQAIRATSKYCTVRCRKLAFLAKDKDSVPVDAKEVSVPNESESISQSITDAEWAALLATLPAGVSIPRTKPTIGSSTFSYRELTSIIDHSRDWYETPAYAELILRLLTWTDEQLADYTLPVWRLRMMKPPAVGAPGLEEVKS